jgi:hypothetical protein
MAHDRHPRGPQRGETEFTTQPPQKDWSPATWVLGCILPLVFLGIPLLFIGWLALYGFLHGFESTTSSTSTTLSSNLLPPTLPFPPHRYYAEFQVHDGASDARTVLTIKDELIRIITVAHPSDIPQEKREAAARSAVVGGVRPTILVGAVTVTVAALEQQDQWASFLLVTDGDLRQALLRMAGRSNLPRPPPGFEVVGRGRSPSPAMPERMEPSLPPPLPTREIYVIGHVQTIHTPPLFHESRSTINIVDLDLRIPASQIAVYERALAKYVDDTQRYEHRYDPSYYEHRPDYEHRPGEDIGNPSNHEDFRSRPIDHPIAPHPFAIP